MTVDKLSEADGQPKTERTVQQERTDPSCFASFSETLIFVPAPFD